ncbi:histidine--tRNA ligase [Neisseria sp. N95_16]|uniref:Histidine--tRNA ligase n=1 Tax=Neisseria brasiliensis TaxID=2666100 RepID=A0A5Q3S3R5_9NEIS|nr:MULTISPECIES: histidine--tRNA ligase [Neisseria]MRN39130.1 histidine--tRNA ligase [Neisseria brasiliensis]PJO10226.1 histidine--tRNA ligase [Neisseria sp. N95_16]PJO78580.1 histidine--tRNA ligase [Neisseria sp. N177_16]QGL25943.1 histidine--tRNA ligase [Neisseria brasiliensis]
MAQKIQSVKGMNDLLPVEQKDFKLTAAFWQAFEDMVSQWARTYGYQQIRTPIVEQTGLFVRSIGEETDVVGKEMYTFSDSNDSLSLSLRPEGTASCLRAVVEHNLLYNSPQKLWYMGPMFRRERPQKGRYRQFHQVGIEALGFEGPDIDAEIIAMSADLWKKLGISDYLTLEINSLGNREERAAHRAALVAYLTEYEAQLDEDSKRRLKTNPLRVLDTKNPELQEICNAAPRLVDYLGGESRTHYSRFKAMLDGLNIQYTENPRLVRGLDYYNQTVFEWTTDKLGAQATVCGGGRYDGLIEELGGKPAASIGFAMGIERLLLLVHEYGTLQANAAPDVYAMHQGEGAALQVMQYAQALRAEGFNVLQHSGYQSLKAQMKKADGSGAHFALIVAQDELAEGKVTLKDMQGEKGQITVAAADLINTLQQWKNA